MGAGPKKHLAHVPRWVESGPPLAGEPPCLHLLLKGGGPGKGLGPGHAFQLGWVWAEKRHDAPREPGCG